MIFTYHSHQLSMGGSFFVKQIFFKVGLACKPVPPVPQFVAHYSWCIASWQVDRYAIPWTLPCDYDVILNGASYNRTCTR